MYKRQHFTTYCLFDQIPAYVQLKEKALTNDEFVAALRRTEVRRSIEEWAVSYTHLRCV